MQSTNQSDIEGNKPPSISQIKSQKMHQNITETEQNLIVKAQTGDEVAFQKLVHQFLPNVLSLSYKILGNTNEAEDMAQEVMLSFWQNIKKYDPDRAKLSTWLYRITTNRCLDRLRKKIPEQLPENYDAIIEAEQDDTLYKKQIGELVENKLQSLPERQYLALILFHHQGHSLNEVAAILECSGEAIESLLARARRSLKKDLSPIWKKYKDEIS